MVIDHIARNFETQISLITLMNRFYFQITLYNVFRSICFSFIGICV